MNDTQMTERIDRTLLWNVKALHTAWLMTGFQYYASDLALGNHSGSMSHTLK